MAGHSKWSQIKRQKEQADARKGKLFTKLVREIMVAVREGGGDPANNPRLRLAIERAKDNNMPLENIERAIKKALGEDKEASSLTELVFEGYGPGGVAILLYALTDNRNRTSSEVRTLFARGGGSLGESGCTTWLFEPRGLIYAEGDDPDEIALLAIDLGAIDVKIDGKTVEIHTEPSKLEETRKALAEKGVRVTSAERSMISKTSVKLGKEDAIKLLKLLEKLEELDEVQNIYTNAEFPDEVLEAYKAGAIAK